MAGTLPSLRQPVCVSCFCLGAVLAVTVLARRRPEFSKRHKEICFAFIWLRKTCYFFSCYGLLIQQNQQQGLEGFSYQLRTRGWNGWVWEFLVRFLLDSCVILTARSCKLLTAIWTFAVLSSTANCSLQWSDLYTELMHAATYREILPGSLKGLHLKAETHAPSRKW